MDLVPSTSSSSNIFFAYRTLFIHFSFHLVFFLSVNSYEYASWCERTNACVNFDSFRCGFHSFKVFVVFV